MTKIRVMDEMPETRTSEQKRPAVLVIRQERREVILSPSRPTVLIFLTLPSPRLVSLLQSKIHSVMATVTPSALPCNIPLKVTAIVCRSKTKRKKCHFSFVSTMELSDPCCLTLKLSLSLCLSLSLSLSI